MQRGTGQGGPDNMPLYCMMVGAQDRELRIWAAAARSELRRWLFVDAFLIQAALAAAPRVLATYANLCAAAGTELAR